MQPGESLVHNTAERILEALACTFWACGWLNLFFGTCEDTAWMHGNVKG